MQVYHPVAPREETWFLQICKDTNPEMKLKKI